MSLRTDGYLHIFPDLIETSLNPKDFPFFLPSIFFPMSILTQELPRSDIKGKSNIRLVLVVHVEEKKDNHTLSLGDEGVVFIG